MPYLYIFCLSVFFVFWFSKWPIDAIIELYSNYWGSALTMLFGSFVAGLTPLGGGAVAFPVFTKLFAVDASDARLFSLAIQAVGMSFASLFFIARRIPLLWHELKYCLPISLLVIPLALNYTTLEGAILKFLFSEFILLTAWVIWLCNHTLHARRHMHPGRISILLVAGAAGSFLSANIGSGADVLLFFVLVYVLKYSIKEAIPTTVFCMAFNALYASLWFVYLDPQPLSAFVVKSWWASCLVVAVGAPLGGYVLSRLNENLLRRFIYLIISLELLSTVFNPDIYLELRYLTAFSGMLVIVLIARKTVFRKLIR
ncbi:sulfite exporter TauE/SafE family protein [Gayadomonas joobiniege]|uniref:sulfite exporter TauE/SafE family protein n=1 Tax=Gayadomonas joobiniege TaxID=1234606 RepID=UPI00036DD3FF|nr:sulfite exporter TauE/SafE family protein [Gayadomonas joobiniege]